MRRSYRRLRGVQNIALWAGRSNSLCAHMEFLLSCPSMATCPKRSDAAEEFWSAHGPKPHCVIRSPNEPIKWP